VKANKKVLNTKASSIESGHELGGDYSLAPRPDYSYYTFEPCRCRAVATPSRAPAAVEARTAAIRLRPREMMRSTLADSGVVWADHSRVSGRRTVQG
jgi:hypothetical protein